MRVVKPAWVEHTGGEKKKKCPVYSLSVHPDGTRLATGGLDRKVKIWSTLPILDPEADKVDENPKLLCAMSEHTGSVLAVRWAHHGRFLASGSDDTVAMIWGLDPEGGGRLWGSDEVNVENWKPLTRLVGHVADIIDMAWSRDDSMLASVGLDSTVWIWDGATFERLRKLDQHQGFVKGVCWDPVGQFLATQSDDKTVKIWNTETWEEVKSVSEPFANSGHATFFRRLSWSPDGAFIAASNAKNGPVFVAAVIERQEWAADISFVGHSNTIQVAAFNPHLFFSATEVPARNTASCVLALGADDFSISIWRNTLHQPMVVLHNIFEHALLDLCWSNDGHHLYGSSEDGTICAISFDDEEIPDMGTSEQTEAVLAEFEYKPQRRIARTLPAPSATVANGFGAAVSSSSTVNVIQARKTRPGDNRRRVNLSKSGPSTQAGPSRQPLAPPPMSAPNGHRASAFDGPIQEQYTSPSQAQASTQRMFEGASTAFAGAGSSHKRRASLLIDDRATKGRNMASSSRVTLDVQEIRAPRFPPPTLTTSNRQLLPLPSVQTMLRAKSKGDSRGVYLEARNAADEARKNTVVLVEDGSDRWIDFTPSPAVALALGDRYSAVGCENGAMTVYSPAGRRLHQLRLNTMPVELSVAGNMVAILTADCEVRVINARSGTAVGLPASCGQLLVSGSSTHELRRFEVHSSGVVVIRTSEPAAYALDPSTSAFVPLITPFELSGSPLFDRAHRSTQPDGPLAEIEADILSVWVGASVSEKTKPEWWDEAMILGHLDMRIKGAELLQSGEEYRHWVLQYIKVVGEEGFRERAEEMIQDLMGPVYRISGNDQWRSRVGDVQKRELVKEAIAALRDGPLKQLAEQYVPVLKAAAEQE